MEGEKRKAEGGREGGREEGRERARSDLDVWIQQPTRARDRDVRAKEENGRQTEEDEKGWGLKCSGDQIVERAVVAEMDGGGRYWLMR